MPNPASSGTGYFDVTAWLTLWGDDNGKGGGWKFMDGCTRTSRSTRIRVQQALQHGRPAANTWWASRFEYRANKQGHQGRADRPGVPEGRPGLGPGTFGIHKGTKNLDAAKKLADWASSKDAMLLYGKNFAITAQPGVAAPLANVPKDYEARAGEDGLPGPPPRTASASSPSGPSATTQERAEPTEVRLPPRGRNGGRGFLEGIRGIRRTFGSFTALRTSTWHRRTGRVRLLPGAVGLRQDHVAAHRRRAGGADRRAHPAGRARHLAPAAGQRDYGIVFQSLRAVSQPERGRQRGLRPGQPRKVPRAEARARVDRTAGWWACRQPGKVPGAAVRRAAAAHRAGARAGHRARAAAAGRAAVGAGRHRALHLRQRDPQPAAQRWA